MRFILSIIILSLAFCFTLSASTQVLKSAECGLPADPGSCPAVFFKWTYNKGKNKCIKFDYSGCEGNDNRFATEEACKKKCVV